MRAITRNDVKMQEIILETKLDKIFGSDIWHIVIWQDIWLRC